jgi:hypothetical protein
MTNLKDFNECPIGEYVRIIQLHDEPVETLTDQELYVLYTKALDDSTSEISKRLGFQKAAAEKVRNYEAELTNRGILTTEQVTLFGEGINK